MPRKHGFPKALLQITNLDAPAEYRHDAQTVAEIERPVDARRSESTSGDASSCT